MKHDPKIQQAENQHLEQAIAEMVAVETDNQSSEAVSISTVKTSVPDLVALRLGLGITQEEFANLFDIKIGTLRNWEQGRRQPNSGARVLFEVFRREPEAVLRALKMQAAEQV